MCGRFARAETGEALERAYKTANTLALAPNYNITPQAQIPVILCSRKTDEREMHPMRWGLVPHWARDTKAAGKGINARAETIGEKPSFRESFAERRCVIPATGFYEWHATSRQPYFVRPREGLMSFAGVWDRWRAPDGSLLVSCAILTAQAPSSLRAIHHRAPVALEAAGIETWLSRDTDTEAATSLLHALPDDKITFHRVAARVNTPKNNDAALMDKIEESGMLA